MLFPGSKTFIGSYLFNPFIIGKRELTHEKSGSLDYAIADIIY